MWALLLFSILRAVAARDCNDYTAVKIVFTFDMSSSTNGPNFANQLKVANAILTTLRKRTKFLHWGAVVFADDAATAYPMQTSNDVPITDSRLKAQSVGFMLERYHLGLNHAKAMLQSYQVSKTAPVTNVMEYILLLGDGGLVVGRDFNLQTYREELFRNSKIVITSALLATPGGSPVGHGCLLMYRKLLSLFTENIPGTCRDDVSHHLFKSLTCPDINADECKKLAIKEMLSTDTVEVVQKRVSSLFGDLVTENNCRNEPPILPIPPTNATNPEQTSTVKPDPKTQAGSQDLEASFPLLAVIIGAVVALLLIVLCVVCAGYATKTKKVNIAEKNQLSIGNLRMNGKHRRQYSNARRRHSNERAR